MSFAYYRWFPGDYARDTGHLTMLQHGAYRQLLDTYMAIGRPLRGDLHALHRTCGALSGEERQAVEFVLGEFFVHDGPVWRHGRCDRELEYLAKLSKASIKANAIRWHSDRNPTGLRSDSGWNPNQNQNQNQNQEEPKTKTRAERASARLSGSVHSKAKPAVTSDDPSFDSFWLAYPKKRSKADARKAWTKLKPGAQSVQRILTSIRNAKASPEWLRDNGRYIQHPATWLNGEGWEDVVAGEPSRHDEL